MTVDLFTPPKTTEGIDPNKNYYEDLVGEDKKFRTNEDLARSKMESDRFIEQLKGELSGIRQELSTRQTLEQLMDKINAIPRAPEENNGNNQTPNNNDGENKHKSFTEEDIARLVESRMSEAERTRVQNANLELVRNSLFEKFGNDYVSKLKEAASALGVEENFLSNMAKEQPKAFLKLIEGEVKPTARNNDLFAPPPGHNIERTNQHFAPTGERLKSYYDELKKKNAAEYWSPSVQNQMHKDAIRLGEKFFNS